MMEKLLLFLNSLDKQRRKEFCQRVGKTENYLRKTISAKRLFREKLCTRIEESADGKVSRKDLRPNDWAEIWPELVE